MKLDLLTSLYVFMLAAFIGFEVIRRVSPLLHTPLMSLTNALDAIAVVGAIIMAGQYHAHRATLAKILGTIAIVAASIFVAPIGARMSHRWPVAHLRRAFACLLYAVAAFFLWKALAR